MMPKKMSLFDMREAEESEEEESEHGIEEFRLKGANFRGRCGSQNF